MAPPSRPQPPPAQRDARIEGDAATGSRAVPDWEAPAGVAAMVTLRAGGVSRGPWGLAGGGCGGWNLASHVGDNAADVAENRRRLRALLPAEPRWLDQVHGVQVLDADEPFERPGGTDAAVSARAGVVLAVLTADCLPVLLATRDGQAIGVAHAGWRGLAAGVLERTVAALLAKAAPGTGGRDVLAWFGPAIGPDAFEVGEDVLAAFTSADPRSAASFRPGHAPGKWFADLFGLARHRLARCGVEQVRGGGWCTVADAQRLYSYRRDRATGRMASLIWRR